MKIQIEIRAWVNGEGKPRMINWDDIDAIEWCNDKLWYKNGKYSLLGNLELMLYTGLKDRNNKKIFDGDIVQCGKSKDAMRAIVCFKQQAFLLKYLPIEKKKGDQIYDYMEDYKSFKVIGNIYETSELLNVESQNQ